MGSQELGFLPVLVAIVSVDTTSDDRQARSIALTILKDLARAAENQIFMGSVDLGLLPVLATLVASRAFYVYDKALEPLFYLSAAAENKVYMGSKELGLFPILKELIDSHKGEIGLLALVIIMNLSMAHENKVFMGSEDLGLLPALVAVVSSDSGEARVAAIAALIHLSIAAENKVLMGSEDLGLVPVLVAVVSSDSGEARLGAIATLVQLSTAAENEVSMASTDLGLVPVLVAVVSTDSGEARVQALNLLTILAFSAANKVYMGSPDLGLLPALVAAVSSDRGEARVNALKAIWNLSDSDENKVYMGSKDLGLLPALVAVVSSDSGEARVYALGAFWYLTRAAENRLSMCSPDLGILPALVAVVSSDSGETRVHAMATLGNLAFSAENKVSMISEELGLLPALVAVVSSDSGVARMKALLALANLSKDVENRVSMGSPDLGLLSIYIGNVENLVSCNGMPIVLSVLQSRESLSFQLSLMVLLVATRELSAARALVAAGGVSIVSSISESSGLDGVKAAIMLSFLLGRDESSGAQLSLLESKPEFGDLLESIFNNTVNGMDGDGYQFGLFDLKVIVAVISSMAVSDKNKAILLQKPTILRCLFQVLSLFLDDAPPIPYRGTDSTRSAGVGGGGQDTESAESAIEALQLLSFASESDSDLRQQYNIIEMDTVSLLKRLSTHSKLSADARRGAQNLRSRLQEGFDQLDISTPSSVVDNKKHLMLSYAWGCRKELVISLQEQLTALGVEVWRDETGSSLLTKMQGATDDVMAQAIELSHTVVVCVSQHYKASANCRQEGKYANSMYKKGKVNVIYVMMDGDYYSSVDGWLAIMLGDSLWYPLWDAKHVSKTASDIAATIAASSNGGATPQHTSTVPPQQETVVPQPQESSVAIESSPDPYDEAWTVLTDPLKASDPEKLATVLSELGLSKACELVDCDSEMWNDLAAYLKPIPKRALLRILAKTIPEK